jgi:hypothetical protein
MDRNILPILLSVAVLFLAGAGCGSPEISAPNSLDWVFRPLAGAQNVALGVTPKVYFNGEVDSVSVTADSVYLESATLNLNQAGGGEACADTWSFVAGQASVEGSVVTFIPDADLSHTTCYRLTCTTAVAGSELGPLQANHCNPEEKDSCRPDVGVEQIFWTIIPVV